MTRTEYWLYDGTLVRMEHTAQGTLRVEALNEEGVWMADMSYRTDIMYDRDNLARKLSAEEAEFISETEHPRPQKGTQDG